MGSAGGDVTALSLESFDDSWAFLDDNVQFTNSADNSIIADVWALVAFSRDATTGVTIFHQFRLDTSVWSHDEQGILATPPSSGGGETVNIGQWGDESVADFFDGLIAAVGVLSRTFSNVEIEAAGLETHLSNWLANSPAGVWRLNQTSTSGDVLDLTDNGADQTSITGTTVITGDDPPGFDFSLGAAQELNVPFFNNSAQIFSPAVANQANQELNVPHFANINQIFAPTLENQLNLELHVPFLGSTSQIFNPQIFNEGDELFEPVLAGNGSLADQIFNGLISQGFLTGSLADRERARLLSKLTLSEPQNLSIQDLYELAVEDNRIAGLGEPVFV